MGFPVILDSSTVTSPLSPTHTFHKILSVGTVVGLPAGGKIDALRIGEAYGVKTRILLHLLQDLCVDLQIVRPRDNQVGAVLDALQRIVEFALDALGCLQGAVLRVDPVLFLNSGSVLRCVDKK